MCSEELKEIVQREVRGRVMPADTRIAGRDQTIEGLWPG